MFCRSPIPAREGPTCAFAPSIPGIVWQDPAAVRVHESGRAVGMTSGHGDRGDAAAAGQGRDESEKRDVPHACPHGERESTPTPASRIVASRTALPTKPAKPRKWT